MKRLFAALGVDYVQWRALTAVYLRLDVRRTGGPHRPKTAGRSALLAYRGLLIVTMMQSAMLAAIAIALRDTFTATVLLTTFSGLNTAILLMADFAGFVVSPDDYWIVGSRPVSARTYFAARLASVLAHVLVLSSGLSLLPALAVAWWHGLGAIGGLAVFFASVLCAMCATVVTIAAYTAIMARVRPERLSRFVVYLQLAASMLFFGGYYFVMRALEEARVRQLSVRNVQWIWAIPSTWFASLLPAATGSAGWREWVAVAAAIALTAICAPLAAGRLSLEYAEHLSQTGTAATATPRRRRSLRVPGFRRGEAHAVATLIRAQFRNDMRFRMAILAILPMTVFYLLMGGGSVTDPFEGLDAQSAPLYFVIVFMPMTLHGALKFSDSWQAAWIFFASPADPARLIVAAKNFVALFFLGGYVLLLSVAASFYFTRIWHAFVHMAVVGAIAHLLLQAAVMMSPDLPFASEPRKAERASRLYTLFFVGAIAAAVVPMALPFVYSNSVATVILVIVLIAATAGLERLVRARARAALLAMEFS